LPATLRDIARVAGVSVATVSRVINNHPHVRADVRDRVMGIVNEARYSTSAQHSDVTNLAFVALGGLSAASLLHAPFDVAVLEGMATAMEQLHFNLVLLDARSEKREDETYSQMFHRRGYAARWSARSAVPAASARPSPKKASPSSSSANASPTRG
jgi:LacI family transcriptional regulator